MRVCNNNNQRKRGYQFQRCGVMAGLQAGWLGLVGRRKGMGEINVLISQLKHILKKKNYVFKII